MIYPPIKDDDYHRVGRLGALLLLILILGSSLIIKITYDTICYFL